MPRVRRKDPGRYTCVFFGDQHFPKEHKPSIETTLAYTRDYQPDFIGLIGDLGDFESPSKYVKHPRKALATQECIDASKNYLKRLRQAAPDAEIVYRLGNHEDRWRNYLLEHPVITELEVLQYESLLGLNELGIQLVSYRDIYTLYGMSVEHGDTARRKAAYTAAGMLDKRGISGISGHTHRLGVHYRTTMSGVNFWIENGCLCDLNPSYANGQPDWQHGFTTGYYSHKFDRWFLQAIPMEDGTILTEETAYYWAKR